MNSLWGMFKKTTCLWITNKQDKGKSWLFINTRDVSNYRTDWQSAKAVLGDTNFLKNLLNYDKDSIPESTLKKLKKYIENPKFVPDQVEKVSKVRIHMSMKFQNSRTLILWLWYIKSVQSMIYCGIVCNWDSLISDQWQMFYCTI